MFPRSKNCSMADKNSKIKIPLYHKTSINVKGNCNKSDGPSKKSSLVSKDVNQKSGTVCEIENAIEIQWSNSYLQTFLILLFLWLPMLLMIFLVHSSASHQIESQNKQVALLEAEMSSMSRELLFLRKKVSSVGTQFFEEMSTNLVMKNDSEVETVAILGDTDVTRIKRDVENEMQSDLMGTSSPSTKVPKNNTARRGKQVSNRKLKRVQAQQRLQCPRRLGYSSTKCGGRHSQPDYILSPKQSLLCVPTLWPEVALKIFCFLFIASSLQAIHLKGAHPETVIEAGHVGPWFIDSNAVRDSSLSSSFQLREDGESIEIESAGLYYIYAQVYYLTSHSLNSFIIKLSSKDSDNSSTLAYCSGNTVSSSATSEVSCFTATIHTLKAGDRIYVQQREKQRRLIMRTGHSFLGIVKFGAL